MAWLIDSISLTVRSLIGRTRNRIKQTTRLKAITTRLHNNLIQTESSGINNTYIHTYKHRISFSKNLFKMKDIHWRHQKYHLCFCLNRTLDTNKHTQKKLSNFFQNNMENSFKEREKIQQLSQKYSIPWPSHCYR